MFNTIERLSPHGTITFHGRETPIVINSFLYIPFLSSPAIRLGGTSVVVPPATDSMKEMNQEIYLIYSSVALPHRTFYRVHWLLGFPYPLNHGGGEEVGVVKETPA